MYRHFFFPTIMLLAVAVIALAACGGATTQPAATNPPTQVPPTVEPTKVPPTATSTVAPTPTATEEPTVEVARPSNEGGPGAAVGLTGDPKAGEQVYKKTCAVCHGDQGKGGVVNKGSDDGTVPPLNPIDSSLIDKDAKVYATNVDLFLEHGSTPSGSKPEKVMLGYGDKKLLTPQQIADVIAYIMSLNPAQ